MENSMLKHQVISLFLCEDLRADPRILSFVGKLTWPGSMKGSVAVFLEYLEKTLFSFKNVNFPHTLVIADTFSASPGVLGYLFWV